MTRKPTGAASLLASLPDTLGRPLAPPELLLIGWTDDEPDLAVVVAHNLGTPSSPDEELAPARQVVVDGAEQVAVIVAVPADWRRTVPAPEAVARFVAAGCARYGLDLLDVLVVRGPRWRSLACTDPTCCPPEGSLMPHLTREDTPR